MLSLTRWEKGTSLLANWGSLSDTVKGKSQSSLVKKVREIPLIFLILLSICTCINQDQLVSFQLPKELNPSYLLDDP